MTDIPELATEDEALVVLHQHIDGWLLAMQAEGKAPMVAASMLFDVLVNVMQPSMGTGAIRTALLWVLEKTYERPTSFAERDRLKQQLDQISNMRRKVEGQPHLIIPDGEA